MTEKKSKIKNIEMWRAIKLILKLNYKWRILNMKITPARVEWYFALQFRRDPLLRWLPRIFLYYPRTGRVAILNHITDPEPTWLSASTIITMADIKVTDPNPNFPEE